MLAGVFQIIFGAMKKSQVFKQLISGWVGSLALIMAMACSQAPAAFDPANEKQVVEIYVRSNFYSDFKVFEKYKVQGEGALAYTKVIQNLEKNIGQWDGFMKKAEKYREKIRKEYPEQSRVEKK